MNNNLKRNIESLLKVTEQLIEMVPVTNGLVPVHSISSFHGHTHPPVATVVQCCAHAEAPSHLCRNCFAKYKAHCAIAEVKKSLESL